MSSRGTKTKAARTAVNQTPGTAPPPAPLKLPKVIRKEFSDPQALYLDTIYIVDNVLTASECQTLRDFLSRAYPLERTAHLQSKSIAWRDVDRVEFKSPELSALIWDSGLSEALATVPVDPGFVLHGLNTKWRVYRYNEGQGFGPHFDEQDIDPLTRLPSLYTLLLYLNDVPSGGETVFYRSKGREVLSVMPRTGLVLIHAQGSKCLLHEGRPVGKGAVKWVLRSDVMVRPAAAVP